MYRRYRFGGAMFSAEGSAGGGSSNGGTPPSGGEPTPPSNGGTPPSGGEPTPPSNGGTPPSGGEPTPPNDYVSQSEFKKLQEQHQALLKEMQAQQEQKETQALIQEIKKDFEVMEKNVQGFNAYQTTMAMLQDPRFVDEKTQAAFKAQYTGSNGVLRYWLENKDTIAAQGNIAGATMDEATKSILEKNERGETLSRGEELRAIDYFTRKNGGR